MYGVSPCTENELPQIRKFLFFQTLKPAWLRDSLFITVAIFQKKNRSMIDREKPKPLPRILFSHYHPRKNSILKVRYNLIATNLTQHKFQTTKISKMGYFSPPSEIFYFQTPNKFVRLIVES